MQAPSPIISATILDVNNIPLTKISSNFLQNTIILNINLFLLILNLKLIQSIHNKKSIISIMIFFLNKINVAASSTRGKNQPVKALRILNIYIF